MTKTNARVKLVGNDGNAFIILGAVSKAIKRSDHPELVTEFMDKATKGDYNNLLCVCMEYVEVY